MAVDCPDCGGTSAECPTCGGQDGLLDISTGAPRKEARAKRAPKTKAPREAKVRKPGMDPAVREEQRQATWHAKALAAQAQRTEREAAKAAKAAAVQARRDEREAARAARAAAVQARRDAKAAAQQSSEALSGVVVIAFLFVLGLIAIGIASQ